MKCPFDYKSKLPPCISLMTHKWGYLQDFLRNNSSSPQELTIIHKIKCLFFNGQHISIQRKNCIKCLFCFINCPEHLIGLDQNLNLKERCSDFDSNTDSFQNKDFVKPFFNKKIIGLPSLKKLFVVGKRCNSLEEFTEVDETENLAVWLAAVLKFLSKEKSPRIGLEIKMEIETMDRGGRLDVSLLSNDKYLFTTETKTNFKKMMQEKRYVTQMTSYRNEVKKTLEKLQLTDIKSYAFLVVGGKETDLLYPDHPQCSSRVGNQADIFFGNLVTNNLFFVTANALWALCLKKLFIDEEKYSLENVLEKIMIKNNYGLTTAGVISRKDNKFIIDNLGNYI